MSSDKRPKGAKGTKISTGQFVAAGWTRRHTIVTAAIVVVVAIAGTVAATTLGNGDDDDDERPAFSDPDFELPQSASEVGVSLVEAGCSEVQRPKYQGAHEITPADKHPPYSSTPPTSGWFYPGGVDAAVYYQPQSPETMLRNMAEGDVIVWHTGLSQDQLEELVGLFVLLRDEQISAATGVELGLEHPIVLTAWRRLQTCDRFSGEAIVSFFETYRGKGAL